MFNAGPERKADITLCLFPHLREFVAVDLRDSLPDGPAVRLLSFDDIFNEDFVGGVESGFSKLIRRGNLGLAEMMSMPQEVENLIRAESLKVVVKRLNGPNGDASAPVGGVGILFFARGLLGIHREQLSAALTELFGDELDAPRMETLETELVRLIKAEKMAEERSRNGDLARLITGEGGPFLTLWQAGKDT